MKKSIPFVLLIALFLMICLIPASEAAVIPDNPEGTSIPTVSEDDSMENNHGIIITNNGTVENNYGIIITNNGTVENNYGTIVDNRDYVVTNKNDSKIVNNFSTIDNNNGKVLRCQGSSEIGTNGVYGTIMELNGSSSVETNNGIIIRMLGGEVTTNNKDIYYVTENSSKDPGVITTNSVGGTITAVLKGTIATNNGTVTRLANGSSITAGTPATYDYRELPSVWVGNTAVTPSVTSGDGWEFNISTNTLRLDNANITSKYSRTAGFMNEDLNDMMTASAVIYNGTGRLLNIVVMGENTISTNSANCFTIYSEGGLNIAGTGSLTINNTGVEGCGGIFTVGSIRVTSGTINSTSRLDAMKLACGDLNIDGGTVSARSTDLGAVDIATRNYGNISVTEGSLTASNEININGDMSVSGGTLNTKLLYANGNGFIPSTVNLSGGRVNLSSSGNIGCEQFTITGGRVNINTSGYISVDQVFAMTAGTIDIRNGGYIYSNSDVMINGGIINFMGNLPDGLPGINADKKFVMTGGRVAVTYATPTADRDLIKITDPPGGSMDYDGATFTNLTQTSNSVKITSSAPASIGFPLPKYTVSFDANSGTGEMPDVENVNEYTLPENGFTPPTDMVFKCWSVNDEEYDPGDVIIIWDDTTVYAEWETQEWMGYTISFSPGEGSGHMDIVYAEGNYEVPNSAFTPPQGKVFWCWTDTYGHFYNPGDHKSLTSDEQFTAHWLLPNTFGVKFDANGGVGIMQPATDLNGEYTLPACTYYAPSATKAFKCWQIGETNYNPGDKINVTANVTVKAIWDTKYTVTFDANGGSCTTPFEYTDGNGKLTALPEAVFAEHWQLGWFTAATGGTAVTTDTVFTQNTTIYAHWGPVTVTFDANGGSCATASAQTNQQNKLASLPAATRENYKLDGWFTASTGGTAVTTDTVFLEDATVYAHWTQVYKVTYNANGGTGDDVVVPNIVGEYTLAVNGFGAPAEKAFKCWQVGETNYNPGDKIAVAANVTVKAVWKDAPAPEPTPTHDGDNYSNTIDAGKDTNVTTTFTDAKASNGTVNVKVGDMDIKFDKNAVSAIGGNTVSLKAEVKTQDTGVEGAEAVIEVTLEGASFSNGTATLSVPFNESVPSGKVLKVYFINGTQKTEMTGATYENGKVVFSTNHFSTYAIMFEDDPNASGGNGGGFPIWIVFVIIGVVAVAGVAVFFFMKKH